MKFELVNTVKLVEADSFPINYRKGTPSATEQLHLHQVLHVILSMWYK